MEIERKFILGGSKITVDGDCSHEIAPWKKSYDQMRQHIKKQKHYFDNKDPMCGCESWTIKKAEC